MFNTSRYLELYIAAGWAGAVIVPLNIRWSVAENRHALEDSGAHLLIVDDVLEAGKIVGKLIPGTDPGPRRRKRGSRRRRRI